MPKYQEQKNKMNQPIERVEIGKRKPEESVLSAQVARGLAGKFIFLHLRDRYAAGNPKFYEKESGPVWVVPLAIVPDGGQPQVRGELVISANSGEIFSHTIPQEVIRRGRKTA